MTNVSINKSGHCRWTRNWAAALVLGAILVHDATAQQPWPTRAVTIVLPSSAGSTPDRVTRAFADRLSKKWGQPVVVDYKPGGTSTVATAFVANAKPDGYTLLSQFTSFVQLPALFKKLPFDPEKSFQPISLLVGADTSLFLVNASAPYQTMEDFVKAASKAQEPMSFSSYGAGSAHHLYGVKLAQAKGIKLLHAPMKSEVEVANYVAGGHVVAGITSMATALPLIQGGRLRALGTVAPQRLRPLPNVPTFTELGAPPDVGGWFGLLAPAGTPISVAHQVSADIREIIRQPDMQELLLSIGMVPVASTPEEFSARIREDVARWKNLLPALGVNPAE